ncbi:hypothetical protein OHB26_28400 [Nocardia sp. NBC_01503]|uniref:hypothetical protein n=1 Tax=Nocardia sp. NBC_01503 TaxID=2975997 RepID=UPI002E7B682E|nr:hypothetical protein [Nocardia sp. NBC_01503]WTL30828.1 hypothetical protein OHB26_28400 [Nocardia sp. NBC_01503]
MDDRFESPTEQELDMGIFRKTKRDPEPSAEQQPTASQAQTEQEAKRRRRRRRLLGGAYTGGWSGS